MRKILPFVLIILSLVLAQSLFAQGNDNQRERVLAELDKTDQMIQQAEDLITSTDNPTGLAFLEQAKQTQVSAKDMFDQNRFIEARRLTLLARDLVRKALKTNRVTEQSGDQALRKLERAEDKLDRAREVLSGSDNPALNSLYESSVDNLKRAWEFYNTKQYNPAARLAEQVEKAAERIINGQVRLSAAEANYERRLETVREAIDQAKMIVEDCQSEQGKTLLAQAEAGLAMAEELASKDQSLAAVEALQRAKRLANRAFRECNGFESLAARYQRLLSQSDEIKERSQSLTGQTKESVDLLLNKANEQLDLANAAIQAGDQDKAIPALQAAQLALRQAEEMILESH